MLWLVWQYFLSLVVVYVLLSLMDVVDKVIVEACEARAYLLQTLEMWLKE